MYLLRHTRTYPPKHGDHYFQKCKNGIPLAHDRNRTDQLIVNFARKNIITNIPNSNVKLKKRRCKNYDTIIFVI